MKTIIKLLIEQERFVEALYFGVLQCKENFDAELHLYLGIACCGIIKPIAELQRIMSNPDENIGNSCYIDGLVVTRSTTMVYEGFFHLFEAKSKNPSIKFDSEMIEIVKEVIVDLEDYLSQEFHGIICEKKYHLKVIGGAALYLLKELIDDYREPKFHVKRMKNSIDELFVELEDIDNRDAEFYKLINS